MKKRRFLRKSTPLIAGASFLALMVGACNKQPTATEAPMVAPPMAALPLAGGAPPPQSLAPVGAALAAPPTRVRYAPVRRGEGYGYIDQAYSMGQAFADTPPDYAVDYQGTRPWIWRAGDGAYRIVERLPQGERFYYYRAGENYPFLVRDPDYSYAYDDNGDFSAVYGPDGNELDDAYAQGRADEASRYLYRARELYRAAQYQQRTSAYANEWGDRQDQLRRENQVWQQQQAQNAQWRAWHEAHQAQEQQQWLPERNQRLAYAAAIGLAVASRGSAPDPAQVSRRQAAYFSNWNASHGQASTSQQAAASNAASAPPARSAPPVAATNGGTVLNPPSTKPQPVQTQKVEVASAQSKAAVAAQVQKQAGEARQRNVAVAQASSAQAARDQQLAAQAQQREAAAARSKAAQDAQAQRLAAQARQHEAAAGQAKAAEAAQQQKAANLAKQREQSAAAAKAAQATRQQRVAADAQQREAAAVQAKAAQATRQQRFAADAQQREAAAAQAKAAQAARAEKSAAEVKQREAATAQAQAAQAARAEKSAADAKQREAAAAQAQAAQAARAERSAGEAKQREAAAAQARAAQEARAKQAAPQAQRENQPTPPAAKKPDNSKRKPPKDKPGDQPQ